MSALLSSEVAAYLSGLGRTVAEPRTVVVDGEFRPAAWFSQTREEHEYAGLYVLGLVPGSYDALAAQYGSAPVYVDQDGDWWYVAGWAGAEAARASPEFHPFGPCFVLQRVGAGLRRAGLGDRASLVRFEWRVA